MAEDGERMQWVRTRDLAVAVEDREGFEASLVRVADLAGRPSQNRAR